MPDPTQTLLDITEAEATISIAGKGWLCEFVVLPVREGWMHFAGDIRGTEREHVEAGLKVVRSLLMAGRNCHVRSDEGPRSDMDFTAGRTLHWAYLRFSADIGA